MLNRFVATQSALLLLVALASGCASTGFLMAKAKVTMFREAGPAKADNAPMDVYQETRPSRALEEIARIECGDTNDDWSMKQILAKARSIGADAVIIVGRVGSYGVTSATATKPGAVVTGTGIVSGKDMA